MKNIFLTFTALAGTMMYGMVYAAAPDCDLVDDTAAAEKCRDMGYVLTRSECGCDSNGNNCDYPALKCPFDDSKVYCYRSKTKVCDVGDVLFNDRRCYEDLKMVPANIKPIGVVFDAENKLAVELEGATNVAAVQSVDQDLLHKYETSSPRMPKPTYQISADNLFVAKPAVTLTIHAGKKFDGTPIPQQVTMNKSVKMSALPELQTAFSTAEYSIGKAISGATTLIDYDSCECSYNIGELKVEDNDIKYKKANLIEAPRKFAKKLLDLQAQNDGKGPKFCPSGISCRLPADLVYPFDGLAYSTQHAVFEPYVENGTNNLRKFENFNLNGINVQNLRSDCAQIQACKNTALNYRSTSSTMGGWKDSNALYDWAAASQSGTFDILQYTGNYTTGTEGRTCRCPMSNEIVYGPGQQYQIEQGRRLKEMNITVVPHGAAKAAERCLALNGGEYTGLLAASGETVTSFFKPGGGYECDMDDTCHDIHVYTNAAVVTSPRLDGDIWSNVDYSPSAYTPPVSYNKWFLPSIGDLGVLGENIQKVNAGLADAARFVARYNYDPKHSDNKIDVKVNLIGINTPTIMKAVNGGANPLLTLNPDDLKQPLKAIGARIRAAKSLEDMEYLTEAAPLLPQKLLKETDDDTGSLLATTSLFTSMKTDLTDFVEKAKVRLNDSGSAIAGFRLNKPTDFMATKTSFLTNESLWSSTMGYSVEDYTGPDAEPAGTNDTTGEPYYTSVTKKGINNYDYTWFYRPLPRTGEAKFGVAQSWQTGDANRPRNVRCVYYYGASADWD